MCRRAARCRPSKTPQGASAAEGGRLSYACAFGPSSWSSGSGGRARGSAVQTATGYGENMANWRVGTVRLWIAASIFWIVGWSAFFIRLAAVEPPGLLEYLTILGIIIGPPGGVGLIGWVIRGFRQRS